MLAANGTVTASNVHPWYAELHHPPFTPPDRVFPAVWTALYLLMGLSAWLVWCRVAVALDRKRAALRAWGWQLGCNALWPAAFFGLHSPGLGLLVVAILLALVLRTAACFRPLSRPAFVLLLPYVAWTGFAAYLNAGVFWLNRG